MNELLIRPACLADLKAMLEIEAAAATRFPISVLPEAIRNESSLAEVRNSITQSLAWLAFVENTAVGFLAAQVAGSSLHIVEMDVLPAYGRQGIGGKLLQHVAQHAETLGFDRLSLTTFANIPWNAPLYARHGFTRVTDLARFPHLTQALQTEATLGLQDRIAMYRCVTVQSLFHYYAAIRRLDQAVPTMRNLLVLMLLIHASAALAICNAELPILAKVEVNECQPIRVGASPSKSQRGSGHIYAEKQGEHIDGTLLKIRVLQQNAVSLPSTETIGIQTADSLNSTEYVFVSGAAETVCPAVLPEKLSIVIESRCCDRLPRTGECLVPFPHALIEKNPGKWFVVEQNAAGL